MTSVAGAMLAVSLLFPSPQAYFVHLINHYSGLYKINKKTALDIAWCESRLTNVPSDYKTEDSYGVYQLGSEFWIRHAQRFGLPEDPLLRKSPEANISLALRVASIDGFKEWACKNKIKNYYYTGQYD